MNMFRLNICNSQGNIPLKYSNQGKGPGKGARRKVTDEEVREMRIMQRNRIPKVSIYAKYPFMSILSLDAILNYRARLSPKCDI